MQIEQAIFTSARTQHGDGYQIVACSPGVTPEQSRELAIWGPSHDALNPGREEPSSVNFHRLTCGTNCISKTVVSGQEYSSRGARIYTQFLLVPPALFARFANNAFAVLRAAWAKGALVVHDQIPSTLEPFTLAGRSATVDEGLLAQLADQFGPEKVGWLVNAAMSPDIKLVAGAANYEMLFGGLLNCFPVECRAEFTFTTGLRYSPRRPFRFAPVLGDASEARHIAKQDGVTVLDLSSNGHIEELTGWAAYVSEAVRSDRLPRLAAELQQSRPELCLAKLNELGEQLWGELHQEPVIVAVKTEQKTASQQHGETNHGSRLFRTDRSTGYHGTPFNSELRGEVSNAQAEISPVPAPSQTFADHYQANPDEAAKPSTVELMERLDRAVYRGFWWIFDGN